MSTGFDIEKMLIDSVNKVARIMLQEQFGKSLPGVYSMYTEDLGNQGGAHRFEYAFLNNLPRMRRWLGARVIKQPRGFKAHVDALTYEATLEISRRLYDQDPTGAVGQAVKAFADACVAEFAEDLCRDSFHSNSGAGPTCFDGTALFNANHPYGLGGAVQSNIGAAAALSDANIKAAEVVAGAWVEENGRPFGTAFDTMIVGPKQKRTAEELLLATRAVVFGSDTAAATIDNVIHGQFKLVIDRKLMTKHWTLQDSTKAKPIALFMPRPPEVVNQDKKEDNHRYNRDAYLFGVEADAQPIGLFWPSVYRGTAS